MDAVCHSRGGRPSSPLPAGLYGLARLWLLTAGLHAPRSGELSLAALVKLALVEAVVDNDAVFFDGTAPATGSRMVAEIVDRIDLICFDLPRHLCVAFASHSAFPIREGGQ